jgi:sulfatase maturation enzyme AslB (radical SAM superfamily)
VQSLKDEGICISVGTSLDGFNGSHDEMRGVPGNFKKVDTLLRALECPVSVGFVLSELTVDNLAYVRAYLKKLGKKPFVQWCNDGVFYHPNERKMMGNRHEVMANIVNSLDNQEAGSFLIKDAWLKGLRGQSIKFPCFALQRFAVLKCNGDIVPCLTMFDHSIGNIREESPEQIWNGFKAHYERLCIKGCPGCLNSWGAGWSYYAAFYPYIQYLKNPKELIKIIGGK